MSKANEYLSKRDLHREYLKSPLWKEFRKKAISHYGAICNRCGKHGTDVDHITYENWGNEKIEDVQILCRPCHEGKHAVERASRGQKRSSNRELHLKGLWAYMTYRQKQKLMLKFDYRNEAALSLSILGSIERTPLIKEACRIMGVNVFGLKRRSSKGWKKKGASDYKKWKKKQ